MSTHSAKKKQRRYDNLHTFIYRLLKHYNPKANMTAECKDILNHLIRDLGMRYVTGCVSLCRYAKKVTIDSNTVITLTNVWLEDPGRLLDFAHDTWDVYTQNTTKGLKKNLKAGLFLPPARFQELFREYRGADQKIGEPAYIFLTAIIEAIFGMILEKAIQVANNDNKITITGIHIFQAINSKTLAFLSPLFKNSFIAGFGYASNTLLFDAQDRYLCRKYSEDSSGSDIS